MSGNMRSLECRIARAVATPPLGVTRRSRRPWITNVGQVTDRSPLVRSGLAPIAMSSLLPESGAWLPNTFGAVVHRPRISCMTRW